MRTFSFLCVRARLSSVCVLCSAQTRHHVYVCMNAERESVSSSCSFVRARRTQAREARACTHLTVECISHRDDWSPSHSNLLLVSLFPIRVLLVLLAPTDLHLCQSIHSLFSSRSLFALSTPLPLTLFSPSLRTIVILPRAAANPLERPMGGYGGSA